MVRHYACNKYKNYSIRNHYFVNGKFETDDPSVQALIEGADGYGVFIHPVETAEEIAQMKAIEEKAAAESGGPNLVATPFDLHAIEEAPIAVQGARGTVSNKDVRRGQIIGVGKK